jgi:hypothetical protein
MRRSLPGSTVLYLVGVLLNWTGPSAAQDRPWDIHVPAGVAAFGSTQGTGIGFEVRF